jgi:uncharacterized membrane protein YeaQ/YmgE (transglycosylase-associated protein family)
MPFQLFTTAQRRILSGLFTNLAAGWIGAMIITPNFSDITTFHGAAVLIFDGSAVILSLLMAFFIEEHNT